MARPADLSQFRVKKQEASPAQQTAEERRKGPPKRIYKGFRVTPEAARQFDILRAETQKPGPELVAEALNLLFERYGKPPLA